MERQMGRDEKRQKEAKNYMQREGSEKEERDQRRKREN